MKERYIEKDVLKVIKRGVYAGSFDPVTFGHLWVIQRAAYLLDELIVGIGDNPDKKYTFTPEDRIEMLEHVVEEMPTHGGVIYEDGEPIHIHACKITVMYFENQFLVDFARQQDAQYIIRGLRDEDDLRFEQKMAEFNSDIRTGDPSITTLALLPPSSHRNLSSSFVKGLCGPDYWQGRVQQMVPLKAFQKLLAWKNCPDWTDQEEDDE